MRAIPRAHPMSVSSAGSKVTGEPLVHAIPSGLVQVTPGSVALKAM